MLVNQRIAYVRKQLKLNQIDFAINLGGYTQSNVSDIERGRVKPDIDFVIKILKIYNVNPFFLLLGEGEIFQKSEPNPVSGHININGILLADSTINNNNVQELKHRIELLELDNRHLKDQLELYKTLERKREERRNQKK